MSKKTWNNPSLTKYDRDNVDILKGGTVNEASTASPKIS